MDDFYKTVKRLYSDPLVVLVMDDLFIDIMRVKSIGNYEAVADGAVYSLTVTKHYRSKREKHGESVKKRIFFNSFSLIDLITRVYICYVVPMKSEKEASNKFLEFTASLRKDLESIRLGRYYSGQT